MVDFTRPIKNQRRRVINPSEVKTTRCKGGPCDGTEVLVPPPEGIREVHGIALPAPPECQNVRSDERNWCIYVWLPTPQQYTWLDFYQTRASLPDQQMNDELVGAMRAACKYIAPDGKRKPR